jgi:hypothetical protein
VSSFYGEVISEVLTESSFIYWNIIRPLLEMWWHGEVRDVLFESILVFALEVSCGTESPVTLLSENLRQIFPSIIRWTGYPVVAAMESLYEQTAHFRGKQYHEVGAVSRYCELMAWLERFWSAHLTGHLNSLPYRAMTYNNIYEHYVTHRTFTLYGAVSHHRNFLQIEWCKWPTDNNGKPVLYAKKSLQFHYGTGHAEVRKHFPLLAG